MKLGLPGRNTSDSSGVPVGDMTLIGHLTELRVRLMKSVLAIVVGAVIVYMFNERIFDFLSGPYCEVQAEKGQECDFLLQNPLEGFSAVLSIAGYGGLILALPLVLYQLARFVLPGLYPDEKKALLPFIGASVVLLALGVTSGYLLMAQTLRVLLSFGSDNFVAMFSPKDYMSFLVKMLLAFGLAAELPLVLIFLQLVGAVKTATLRKNRRIALVIVIVLAAIITPTGDPFTLLVLGVPMYLFYEISLFVGGRMTRTRAAA